MKSQSIRASAMATFAAFALVAISAGGASAAEPVTHHSGSTASASVVHVSGTSTAPQTIHQSTVKGGALLALRLGV